MSNPAKKKHDELTSLECGNKGNSISWATLLEAQLNSAVKDAEMSVHEVLSGFMSLLQQLDSLEARLSEAESEQMRQVVFQLVERLQFFDVHSQRIAHVAETLNFAALLKEIEAAEGDELKVFIKGLYSTSEERAVHNTVLGK